MKELIKACKDSGLWVSQRADGQGHYIVAPKEGSKHTVRFPSTPGDKRAMQNAARKIGREFGLRWRGRYIEPQPRRLPRS